MNILIIGNGFDLAHGLPTSYDDFLNLSNVIKSIYCFGKKQNIDKYVADHNISEKIIPFVEKINDDICVNEVNENNIHSNKIYLTKIKEVDEFYDCIKNNIWIMYFNRIRKNISGKNWIDFEKEISNVIKELVKRRNCCLTKESCERDHLIYMTELCETIEEVNYLLIKDHNRIYKNLIECKVSKISIDQIDDILSLLQKDLDRITRALEIYISYFVENISVKNQVAEIQDINPDYVLSFNYSDTYESRYGSQKKVKQYSYIHGKADINHTVENCNLILGIDEFLHGKKKNKQLESLSFKKFYQRIYKSPDNNYLDWVDEIKDGYKKYINRQKNLDVLLDKSYSDGSLLNNICVQKNLQDMAMEECPKHKVYIFGHSLDVTDKDILKLFICNDNVETEIYYYRRNKDDKESLGKIIKNLIKIMGQKELIRRTGGTHKTIKFIPQEI